jgi:hypothetical protein
MQSPVEIRAKGLSPWQDGSAVLHEVVLKQLPPEAPESSAQEGSREGARAFFQQRMVPAPFFNSGSSTTAHFITGWCSRALTCVSGSGPRKQKKQWRYSLVL